MVSALYLMAVAAITSTVLAAPQATSEILDDAPSSTDVFEQWPAPTNVPQKHMDWVHLEEAQGIYLQSVCMPTWHNFTLKYATTAFTDEAYADVQKLMEDGPFPCEREWALSEKCAPKPGMSDEELSPEAQKKEYECVCSNKLHEMQAACVKCKDVHGFSPQEAAWGVAFASLLETMACSASPAPTANYNDLYTSVSRADGLGLPEVTEPASFTIMGAFETGADEFPSQTNVCNYYTSGSACATGTAASATGSETQASGTVSGTGAAPAATSAPATGGATELRAAGGLVMALLGVMAAL